MKHHKTVFLSASEIIPEVGLEPTRPCGHGILNPARLPIPPLRLELGYKINAHERFVKSKIRYTDREKHACLCSRLKVFSQRLIVFATRKRKIPLVLIVEEYDVLGDGYDIFSFGA